MGWAAWLQQRNRPGWGDFFWIKAEPVRGFSRRKAIQHMG
jgi:hypothetical protein